MRTKLLLIALSLCVLTATTTAQDQRSKSATRRQVAVTFDDLPSQPSSVPSNDVPRLRDVTTKLLKTLTSNHIPAIGFVNEGKLYRFNGELDPQRVGVLKMWLDAGLELGNHTYSHPYFYEMPLAKFQANVIEGEKVTRTLLSGKGMKLRYFRHPFLNTGPNLETKRAFEKFLAARGYRVAPVTIDNMEWIFAGVYAKAMQKGDGETARRVADAYVSYMDEVFAFYEKLSRDTLGYEVPQILLVHANTLNADHFDRIVEMMKSRGYEFITLDEALKDKAYNLPDTYTGPVGISWLQRWAISRGGEFRKEPYLPPFMRPFDHWSASRSDYKTERE